MDGGVAAGRVVDPGPAVPQSEWACSSEAVSGPVVMVEGFRAWLACVDAGSLSDRERVDLVASLEGAKGAISAVQARATDALRCSREVVDPRDVGRSVGSMVALARRESPSLGDRFVGLSRALVHEMPATMAALSAGSCSERVAVAVVQATATSSMEDRSEVDARVGPLLGRLGVKQAGAAAGRVAAELDAASVVARMEAAVKSRRVTVRPAPDGMAYLSVVGPLQDVVGAYAALQARSRAVVAGQCPDEEPQGRGVGAVAADTALRVLSGRAVGQLQPVEVHLVMTDRALLGSGDPDRSVMEPARIPGHGSVPAPVARAWLRERLEQPQADGPASVPGADREPVEAARVWVRRLYATPDGRDLVAMDSRRRLFGGLLRRMLVLRDDVCTTPWCEAPIVHADHAHPLREGGRTEFAEGNGKCARCNQTKEAPGWRTRVVMTNPHHDSECLARRMVQVSTPLRHRYDCEPPPLLGWGSQTPPLPPARISAPAVPIASDEPAPPPRVRVQPPIPEGAPSGPPEAHRRKRALLRTRTLRDSVPRRPRRPRLTSHLEQMLCRYLT